VLDETSPLKSANLGGSALDAGDGILVDEPPLVSIPLAEARAAARNAGVPHATFA
jgi:hypothetical protein